MPSDDFMGRVDDEREMTAIADDIDDLDDAREFGDDHADEEDTDTVTFASLGLSEEILAAVTDMGFRVPAPTQAAAIPSLLELRDVAGIAQTGTGKTAAFDLPLLAIVDADGCNVQALILAPTRELAMQSAQAIEDFAARTIRLDVIPVYGDSLYGPQIGALKRRAQAVVGTPDRVTDLIEKGALDLPHVRMLVLDEADEMLCMGFVEDVETIASSAPDDRLTTPFSATVPAAIEKVVREHLKGPVKVAVFTESSTIDIIHQTYAVVPYKHKIGALSRVLVTRAQHIREGQGKVDATIVSVCTRADVGEVSLELSSRGFRAAGISGDVAQAEREYMVERLKNGSPNMLVATDVAARGLDVERISLAVNFDVPRESEAYVHRIDRTGRAGREGRALTFFTSHEHGRLRHIEKLTDTEMEEVEIPSPTAVSGSRASRLLEGLSTRIEHGRLDMYKRLLTDLGDEISVEDIAAALMATAVGDEGPAPRVEKDRRDNGKVRREEQLDESGEFIGATLEAGRDKDHPLKDGANGARRRAGGYPAPGSGTRYRIEVGKKGRVKPGSIVGAIAGEGGIDGRDIGNIEIYLTFSLVDITVDLSSERLSRISKGYMSGRQLCIRMDEGPGGRSHGDHDDFERRERRDLDRDNRGRGGYGDREDRFGDRDEKRPYRLEKGDGSRPRRNVCIERWEKDIKRARREREGGRDGGWDRDGSRDGGHRHFGKRRYDG